MENKKFLASSRFAGNDVFSKIFESYFCWSLTFKRIILAWWEVWMMTFRWDTRAASTVFRSVTWLTVYRAPQVCPPESFWIWLLSRCPTSTVIPLAGVRRFDIDQTWLLSRFSTSTVIPVVGEFALISHQNYFLLFVSRILITLNLDHKVTVE